MPTSIDAAIKEALAAIDDELESTASEYSSSDEEDDEESLQEEVPSDKPLTHAKLYAVTNVVKDVGDRGGQTIPSIQKELDKAKLNTPVKDHQGLSQTPETFVVDQETVVELSSSQISEEAWTSPRAGGRRSCSSSYVSTDYSHSESDDDYSSDSSCDSSDLSDDDEQYLMVPTPVVRPLTFPRSTSVPRLPTDGAEINATQVSVLLNNMRMKGSQVLQRRRSSSAPNRRTTSLRIGRPKHIQGHSMESCVLDSTDTGTDFSELVFKRGSGEKADATDDPSVLLQYILEDDGYEHRLFKPEEVDHFFFDINAKRVNSYSLEVIAAVKAEDIELLRCMHFEEKVPMDCCNRFGESVLHAACRRGCPDVVHFLIHEANVDLRVRDDFGRTPMHDACWTPEPDMELVKLLLQEWPDLLLVKDKRGFSPLQYVRKAAWKVWIEFFDENRELTSPKLLLNKEG